jgi:hypothetical protein
MLGHDHALSGARAFAWIVHRGPVLTTASPGWP